MAADAVTVQRKTEKSVVMKSKVEMNPEALMRELCGDREKAFQVLFDHGSRVAEKALRVADNLSGCNPDMQFVREAAILHDVGVLMTRSGEWGCNGKEPYIRHGVLGREMLEKKGLPRHGRVCECHVGVGIGADNIRQNDLPLPLRDMIPETLEEEIICYADKFFSKNGKNGEKSLAEAMENVAVYGPESLARFKDWVERFER